MKKPLDVRGNETGVVDPGLASVKGAALKKRAEGKKSGSMTYEKHIAKHTKKENTYSSDCSYCN